MEDIVGKRFGQYEIIQHIGRGGMAYVFKAYQQGLDRFVAIKILSPRLAEEPGFRQRFQREAQAAARLNHPNILQVHDFGQHDHYYYLVTRYVENSVTLDDLIQQQVPTEKLVDYIVQVADALSYAHEQGMVHRDVKPSNILIDGKWALLSDFGLVKMSESSTHLTKTGISLGTPAYMSPEQATGRHVDSRTDIYALGIILYRVLTGTIPHDAPTPVAIAIKRNSQPVPPLRQYKPDIPEPIEQVVLRSLAIEPESRFSTAVDFSSALRNAATQQADLSERTVVGAGRRTTGSETAPPGPIPSPKRTGLAVGGFIAVLVLIAAIGLGFFIWINRDESSEQSVAMTGSPGSDAGAVVDTVETPTGIADMAPTDGSSGVANTRLEVWSGPGEGYVLIGYLPEGATAEITGRDETSTWWQIRTSLADSGRGWLKVDSDFEVIDAENVPIALIPSTPVPTESTAPLEDTAKPSPTAAADTPTSLASPTPTPTVTTEPTHTSTPTGTPSPAPTRTNTPTRTVSSTSTRVTAQATPRPTPSPEPTVPAGEIVLVKPVTLDDPTYGPTEFQWRWSDPVPEDQGFEVRVWRDGEPPLGVHNSVLDNKSGVVQALGSGLYQLAADISQAAGVLGRRGEYNWTVLLVQIEPEYKELGIQAPPGRLRFEPPGGGGGGGGSGGGSSQPSN
jgi:hypothetical protein